jgi:hypothetical protein
MQRWTASSDRPRPSYSHRCARSASTWTCSRASTRSSPLGRRSWYDCTCSPSTHGFLMRAAATTFRPARERWAGRGESCAGVAGGRSIAARDGEGRRQKARNARALPPEAGAQGGGCVAPRRRTAERRGQRGEAAFAPADIGAPCSESVGRAPEGAGRRRSTRGCRASGRMMRCSTSCARSSRRQRRRRRRRRARRRRRGARARAGGAGAARGERGPERAGLTCARASVVSVDGARRAERAARGARGGSGGVGTRGGGRRTGD